MLKEAFGNEAGAEAAALMDRIDPLRGDIAELRREMDEVRIGLAEINAGIAAMDKRHVEAISAMDKRHVEAISALNVRIAQSKADLITWSFVFWVGAVGAIAMLAGVLR